MVLSTVESVYLGVLHVYGFQELIDTFNWVEVFELVRMSEAQGTLTDIERLIGTLNDLESSDQDISSYIDKLESEQSELERAMKEPDHVQMSIEHTTKKNVVFILSELPSEVLSTVVEKTDFEESLEDQLMD